MKLKLDENIGRRGVELLVQAGHDAATVFSQGVNGINDEGVIQALPRRRPLPCNSGFGFCQSPALPANRVCRDCGAAPAPAPNIGRAFGRPTNFYRGIEPRDIIGKLWIIQKGKIRTYQPED